MLQGIRKAARLCSDEDFEAACGQKFVLNVSSDSPDDKVIELCTNGGKRELTRKNSEEFIELTVKKLLNRNSA